MSDFRSIDKNDDGYISLDEFTDSLRARKLPCSHADALNLFNKIDHNRDGKISKEEYTAFAQSRESELLKMFQILDRDKNGILTSTEMQLGIQGLGLKVSSSQLRQVMESLSAETQGKPITFDIWREALLLLPEVNPEAVFENFYDTAMTDDASGESTHPRNARTQPGESTWQGIAHQLYAGCIAGCVSRSATAPLERFKVVAQGRLPGSASLGIMSDIKSIYSEGGLRAFWRGNGANCLKIAPETGVKFVLFEAGKDAFAMDSGNVTLMEKFICACLASSGAQFSVYPLEVIKTRVSLAGPGLYTGLADCARKIIRSEGVAGLYKGLGPSVVGILPYAGIDLTVNSVIREKASEIYRQRNEEPGVVMLLTAGCVSSASAMTLTFPLNLIRTRLQASGMPGSPVYTGSVDCLRKTIAADGFRGLYRGLSASIIKVFPSAALSCAVYNTLKNH